jgi:protocatechuate 3,4-dioxygenase beta subunit
MTRSVFLVLLAIAMQSPPQTPAGGGAPVATGLLMGQVVDSHGAGVSGAVVTLRGGFETVALTIQTRAIAGGPQRALTTDDGRFVFFNLPAGSYAIEASKPGFLPGAFGRRRFGGPAQSIALAEGEKNIQVRIAMWEFATISGRVIDDVGEPAVGVQVRALRRVGEASRLRWTAVGDPAAMFADLTDDRGEYRLDRLVPGDYLIAIESSHVTIPATIVDQVQSARAAGTAQPLLTQLMRAAVQGAVNGPVQRSGDWVTGYSTRSAMTLPSAGADGRLRAHPTVFYPSARSVSTSTVIRLAAGEERPGVDLQMPLVTTSAITGTITGPQGPMAGLALALVPAFADEIADERLLEMGRAVTNAAGQFAMLAVPPGQYLLRAHAAPGTAVGDPKAPGFRGAVINHAVTVTDTAPAVVNITLRPGARVSGRVVFDGALPKPAPERMARYQVRLDPVDPNVSRNPTLHTGTVDRDGNFAIEEVPPGRYLVLFLASLEDRRAMAGWETKGATLSGRDVSTRPMDVSGDVTGIVLTVTDRPSELAGTARTAEGAPDPSAAVVMFSAERELWTTIGASNRRFRAVRAAENGTYLFRGVPEGDYFVAAIPDEEAVDWLVPSRLEALARVAVKIAVRDEEKKSQELTTRRSQR